VSPPAADPLLARLERGALVFTALATAVSVGVRGGRFDVAWGIVGGGLLTLISYWAIRSGIASLVDMLAGPGAVGGTVAHREEASGVADEAGREAAGDPTGEATVEPVRPPLPLRARPVMAAVRFAGRYALLGFLAYVMIARLRLHPVGLLGGVTSFVVAVALEARRPRARQ
jgi:hypothetical protein